MKLKDKKGRVFEAKLYKNVFLKGKGLMFSRKLKNNVLIFENFRESSLFSMIHTWFVFQNIDVVWMDKNKKIVDIKRKVRPFSFNVKPSEKAKYFIEMADSRGLKVGEKLRWK